MSENTETNVRMIRRSRSNRMVSGLCGGAAEYLDMDANLLRILLVALTVFGVGTPVLAYLICWFIVPEQD